MVVVLFGNDSDEVAAAIRSLEDRRVAKYHAKCVFVRIPYQKDTGETANYEPVSSSRPPAAPAAKKSASFSKSPA